MVNIVIGYFMLGLLALIFVTPCQYAQGILKMVYGQIYPEDKIKCYIPIYNTIYADKQYNGRISMIGVSTIAVILSFAFRLGALFVIPPNTVTFTLSYYLLMISFVLFFIANVISVFIVLKDLSQLSMTRIIMYSVLFPLGQRYIGLYLMGEVKKEKDKKSVFK